MMTVHPRFRGNRATVLVNYHGSDTFRFSSTEIDAVEHVDRFGYRHRYKTLTKAFEGFFMAPKPPLETVAFFLSCESIEVWEAQHIALRLKLEDAEGFADLDIEQIESLPSDLEAQRISVDL